MDRNDENRDRLRRNERSESDATTGNTSGAGDREGSTYQTTNDRTSDERTSGDRGASGAGSGEKGSVDRLIDKAQEKGIFQKAEKFVRDRFGGGGSSGRR